ncbi:MAG: phasin family protein [Deltaproteobacteria bacterium]|nr:phasin family protein [Deltaproteobacteria bacterium]
MANDGNANFEIPKEMREFAEKSVAQAKVAFDSFISATQHAVNTAESQAATARTGAKAAGELAMSFAEVNIASSFEFAQRLLRAKDPREVAALHAEYVKSQIAVLTEQAKELSKQAAKMAGQSATH